MSRSYAAFMRRALLAMLAGVFSGVAMPQEASKPDKAGATTADTTRRNAKAEVNRGVNAELVRSEMDVLTGRLASGDCFASVAPDAAFDCGNIIMHKLFDYKYNLC